MPTIKISHRVQDGRIIIVAVATCKRVGRQEKEVADVVEGNGPNPILTFLSESGGITVGLCEKICAYVRSMRGKF